MMVSGQDRKDLLKSLMISFASPDSEKLRSSHVSRPWKVSTVESSSAIFSTAKKPLILAILDQGYRFGKKNSF